MTTETFIKTVTSPRVQVFLDHSVLKRMGADEMTAAMLQFYHAEYPPVVVDNLRTFFSLSNLEKELIEPGTWVPFLLAERGIQVTPEEIETLMRATAIRKRLLEAAREAGGVDYPFARVPDGWVFDDVIEVKTNTVRRKTGDTGYSIGHKSLLKVWKAVSPVWAGFRKRDEVDLGYVDASGYRGRSVSFDRDGNVKIGCQTIQRFELEQVAVHMGWDMPKES